ncbi:MAG: hypothetical protein ACHQRM_09715 [Bacteroidia bacterium]
MITYEVKNSLNAALKDLQLAESELNRPNEDVVTMSVCLTARRATNSLLRTYLQSRSINHSEGKSLLNLLNLCKTLDKQFEAVDISLIACNEANMKECECDYCLSPENVTDCYKVAVQIKNLVLQKLKVSEHELA